YQKAYKYLQKKGEFDDNSFNDFEKEAKVLGRMIVRKKLKPLRKGVQTLRFINFTGIYKQLFTDASWVTGEKPKEWD
ncbi:UNVERIFIED_CONTAM: hypothetical protein FO527_31530, partial [Bacillus sp. ATCC 13368]